MAIDSLGGFVATWLNDQSIVLGQRDDASGTPVGGEFQVHAQAFDLNGTSVELDGTGSFVVTWSGNRGCDMVLTSWEMQSVGRSRSPPSRRRI